MVLTDFRYYECWCAAFLKWCENNNKNFEILKKNSEVLTFNNSEEVQDFLKNPNNINDTKKLQYEFTVKNSWLKKEDKDLSNNLNYIQIIVHQRHMRDYTLESDTEETYLLIIINEK